MSMNTPIIYRYPLDGTGLSPDNLVVGEEHQLSNRAFRCVAPTYGGFFAESVVVVDSATSMPLVHGLDYIFGELFEFPTGRYGKEIFGLIVVTKPNVSKIAINYQCLGGDYSYSMDAIIAMIDNLNLGERPVEWGSIINRPALFDPATHFHDLGDVYGFEYVVHSLERLRQAILIGDVASHDEIYRYVDRVNAEQTAALNLVRQALVAHIADKGNPHQVTKAQVGLGNVNDYPMASIAEMDAGLSSQLYVSPALVNRFVTNNAINPLLNHIADKANPHQTTKAQVGLGVVENYPPANTAVAAAGVSDAHYMTPRLVRAEIQRLSIDPMTEHIADKLNPHSTTKAQVGLGSVENYPVATQTQMDVGTANNLYLTPATVSKFVTDRATTPLNNHIADKGNPHNTTKAQVGLGNVENYPVATDAIAAEGTSSAHYMTPRLVKNELKRFAIDPLAEHTGNRSNPHAVTKAQVGLGNVQDYATASQAQMDTGLANNLYLTPNTVAVYVNARATQPLLTHIADKGNPHQVTKTQVGLGSVENYPIAPLDVAVAGVSTSHYMTPRSVNEAILRVVGNRYDAHAADYNNPHRTTKAQVGLGSVENFRMATVAEMQYGYASSVYVSPMDVRHFLDANFVYYINNYHATIQEARDGARDDRYITPWHMNVVLSERLNNYYTRADVDWLINNAMNQSQFVFTYGAQQYTSQWQNGPYMFRDINNFDVFPPSGKSMANLVAFIPSIAMIHYAGDVNTDDSMRCIWSNLGDRIRVYVQNTEIRAASAANWLAVWK